jgi:hypothetical protein
MTKYEEIARLAVEHSREVHASQADCERFAFHLIKGLREYLQCPEGTVSFLAVDANLLLLGEPGDANMNVPELRFSDDAFWYFGVRIHFSEPTSNAFSDADSLIGVQRSGKAFMVRAGRDFVIDLAKPESTTLFFDYLCADFQRFFCTPVNVPAEPIGFRPRTT